MQKITNRLGREYWINDSDAFYLQRLGRENGPYQMRNLIALRKFNSNPHTIIDIGMNIGMNTIEYSTFAKRVIGFELVKETFKLAKTNIELNKNNTYNSGWWKDNGKYASLNMTGKIEIHNIGLGEKKENVQIVHHKKNAGHDFVKRNDKKEPYEILDGQITTLDSYKFTNIDIIKIDTEGFELFVIKGAVKTIKRYRPIVQLEIVAAPNFKRAGYTPQDLLNFFFKNFNNYLFCNYKGDDLGRNWKKIKGQMDYFFIPKERTKTVQKRLCNFVRQK